MHGYIEGCHRHSPLPSIWFYCCYVYMLCISAQCVCNNYVWLYRWWLSSAWLNWCYVYKLCLLVLCYSSVVMAVKGKTKPAIAGECQCYCWRPYVTIHAHIWACYRAIAGKCQCYCWSPCVKIHTHIWLAWVCWNLKLIFWSNLCLYGNSSQYKNV